MIRRRIPRLALAALFCAAPALAQTDAGSLLRQQEQQQQRVPSQLPTPEREAERAPLQIGSGQTVQVKAIRFTGTEGLASDAELQALVADAIGRALDFPALQQLAERVTAHLKARGWFLARAYLPQQDVTGGTVEIAAVAGRLAAKTPVVVTSEGKLPLRIDRTRLQAMAESTLDAGRAARESELNRAVLLMNDLPGITARARLERGDEPGETRVAIGVSEGPLLNINAGLDNFGNRDTGREQLSAGLGLNDPLRLGDQLNLAATASRGMALTQLSYSLPLGSQGWRLSAHWSGMDYKVRTEPGRTAALEGDSRVASLGVTYPIVRDRTTNLRASVQGQDTRLNDRSSAGPLNERHSRAVRLGLNGDLLDTLGGGGLTSASLVYSDGRLDLRQPGAAAADAASYGTAGRFDKWTFSFSRLQKLPGAFSGLAALYGQMAGKNLDSSEKMALGGPFGVRAYAGNEANADSAAVLNLELRYDWPGGTPLGALQVQGFYDTGWARLHDDARGLPISTATGSNSYRLRSLGLGFTLSQIGRQQIRAVAARALGDNPGRSTAGLDADGRDGGWRLWLQAAVAF